MTAKSEIYKKNFKFHLASQGKCNKMDRRRRKDGKQAGKEGKRPRKIRRMGL